MALADRYGVLLVDVDGTVTRGAEPVGGAAEVVRTLHERGRRLAFVTNNSTRAPEEVVTHLKDVGIDARVDEIVTSAMATASVLAERSVGTAFVVGERALRSSLESAGITVVDGDGAGQPPDVVVVGLDRGATYASLRSACLYVQRGADLVATGPDTSYPEPEGLSPGTGALTALVTATTGAEPLVIGKPFPGLLVAARNAAIRAGADGEPLVVGDRLDTDVAGAAGLGWDSLLVLTGVVRDRETAVASPWRPTYIGNDLRALLIEPEPDEVLTDTGSR
ncbi:MAG: HAD-IIA family hydrolase [Actinomycetota bacterium]